MVHRGSSGAEAGGHYVGELAAWSLMLSGCQKAQSSAARRVKSSVTRHAVVENLHCSHGNCLDWSPGQWKYVDGRADWSLAYCVDKSRKSLVGCSIGKTNPGANTMQSC